jgi:hypothetical protein
MATLSRADGSQPYPYLQSPPSGQLDQSVVGCWAAFQGLHVIPFLGSPGHSRALQQGKESVRPFRPGLSFG